MEEILKYSNVDIEKIKFNNIKKTNNGYIIYLKYENDKPIYIQTPKLNVPYGVSIFDENKPIKNYNLSLSFKGENKEKVNIFKNIMEKIDDKIHNEMKINPDWYSCFQIKKEELTEEIISLMHSKIIKNDDKENNYPAMMNIRMDHKNDNFNFSVYEIKKEKDKEIPEKKEINFDNIKKLISAKSDVRCIIYLSNIWIYKEKFGVTIRLKQLAVYPSDEIKGYYLLSSSDEEND